MAGTPVTAPLVLAVGGTVDLQVYLREAATGTVLSTQKLFSAAVRVTYDTPPDSGTPSGIAAVQSVANMI